MKIPELIVAMLLLVSWSMADLVKSRLYHSVSAPYTKMVQGVLLGLGIVPLSQLLRCIKPVLFRYI